jgi:hypothetical protein
MSSQAAASAPRLPIRYISRLANPIRSGSVLRVSFELGKARIGRAFAVFLRVFLGSAPKTAAR